MNSREFISSMNFEKFMLANSQFSRPPHHELFPLFFVSMNKNKIRKNNLKLEFYLLRIDCIVLLYHYITRLQILLIHPVTMSNDEDIFDDFDFIIAVVMMSVNWFLLMAAGVNMQREEYHSIMLELLH